MLLSNAFNGTTQNKDKRDPSGLIATPRPFVWHKVACPVWCISWRTHVPDLRAGNFEPTAPQVTVWCAQEQDTGLEHHVDLQGLCCRICLSNAVATAESLFLTCEVGMASKHESEPFT